VAAEEFEKFEVEALRLKQEKLNLEHEDYKQTEKIEEEKEILSLDRKARMQEREYELENTRLAFERQQREADERLQHEQTLRALEYHERLQASQAKLLQDAQNAEHQRRFEAVKYLAGKPPEEQLILAMQFNPELQQAFIALQDAKSNEQKVAMAQHFQGQIQDIYGAQSEQTNQLLLAAAQALGLAASSKSKDAAPPLQVKIHNVSGEGPSPEQPN